MAELVVIVPSHGRPDAACGLVDVFCDTCTADTFLAFAVDQDDPRRAEYESVGDGSRAGVLFTPTGTMVQALNHVALAYASDPAVFAVGFMGDDHRPRSQSWDQAYLKALRELAGGIVYGNDLLQGARLPTQFAVTADIVRAVGHMSPPGLRHMYVDNYWLDLGSRAGCLRYLPDVVVEHVHPVAGKAEWDEGYRRVNAPGVYAADAAAYRRYCGNRLAADVEMVRALRGAR